ncbi:MAG TPA: HEAT repeat domain-containing protein [Planctomicrobium sp.]|nr:HEAT repeat domain-containing protein [Planctomicrobium sp.]
MSLLLAPLFLASASGCATSGLFAKSNNLDARAARVDRLLSIAVDYENNGRQDAAMSVYQHVLAQNPENTYARQRYDLLAQSGIAPSERSTKSPSVRRNQLAPPTPDVLIASRREAQNAAGKSVEPAKSPATNIESVAKNTAAQNRVAQNSAVQNNVVQNSVTQNGATEISVIEETTSHATQVKAEFVKAEPARPVPASSAPVAKTPAITDVASESWTPRQTENSTVAKSRRGLPEIELYLGKTKASGFNQDSRVAEAAPSESLQTSKEWTTTSQARTESDVVVKTETETSVSRSTESSVIASQQSADWTRSSDSTWEKSKASSERTVSFSKPSEPVSSWNTTDLTRVIAEDAKATDDVHARDDSWEPTRLITLCDGLPEELIPLVEKLESDDPLVRVQGLQGLAENREHARPAVVAVHSLLEDREPVVAVYAASTLREIANDAWSSVRTLTHYLKHEDPQIVRLSAYLLGQMGPEAMDAVPTLELVRESDNLLSSLHAAEALTHIAPADRNSFQTLSKALSNEDETVRWFAAVSMGTVSSQCEKDAVAALVKALKDSEPEVRAAACLSLGGLGEHAMVAISDLEDAAQSESSEVKVAAETALACLRDQG